MADKPELLMDNNCHIGMSIENIQNWAEYYLTLKDKLSRGQQLTINDQLHLQLLLHDVASKMLNSPESYLNKQEKGRPNQQTKLKVRRHITILFAINAASSLKEAREKTAKHFKMSYEAVDKASRNMDLSKYLNNSDGNN